jgi:hypothetical protein
VAPLLSCLPVHLSGVGRCRLENRSEPLDSLLLNRAGYRRENIVRIRADQANGAHHQN